MGERAAEDSPEGSPAKDRAVRFLDGDLTAVDVDLIFEDVVRVDLSKPGFHAVATNESQYEKFLSLFEAKFVPTRISWQGRFDQPLSAPLHRDGAASQSILVLGYEPTPRRSDLLLKEDREIVRSAGGEIVRRRRLRLPNDKHVLVVVNNSSDLFDGKSMLGLLHGSNVEAGEGERFISSTMLEYN